jgi:hypothetical protein
VTIHWHFEKSSPQTVVTGESDQSAGSHGAVTKYNSGAETVICSPVLSSLPANLALLRAPFYSRVQQALVDSFALLFCVFFMITVLLSVPLAVFLLLFASF